MAKRGLILLALGLVVGVVVGVIIVYGAPVDWLERISDRPDEGSFNAFEGLQSAPRVGASAPDFGLTGVSGQEFQLSDFRGRPVLVNFWATWCGPCLIEMPAIQAQYERHQPELVVLAVNFDEPASEVQKYVEDLSLTFPVLLDPGGEVNASLYRVRGYPSSIFVDEDGVIRAVHIGMMTEGQLTGYLDQIGVGS